MGNTRLTIQLVTWNSIAYLPYFISSLKQQSFTNWDLVVVDNAATDCSLEYVRSQLDSATCIQNHDNKGFAAGQNQAFNASKSEYVLVANPDLLLPPNCLEALVTFLDSRMDVAVVAPLLIKWNFQKMVATKNISDGFSNTIDSFGLEIKRNRRVVEKLSGITINPDTFRASMKTPIPVFGVSGALFLGRRKDLEKVLVNNTLFDESYGSYKEDVDLAYRLTGQGLLSYVLPTMAAYHARGAGANGLDDLSAAKNKTSQSFNIKYFSYRNHLYNLIKNEHWQNLALDFPFIMWYELKKFGWFLLFDRAVLGGLDDVWRMRKDLKNKRLNIKEQRKANWLEIRKWFY